MTGKKQAKPIMEWCTDKKCEGYKKRLVDRGYGIPVCPTVPWSRNIRTIGRCTLKAIPKKGMDCALHIVEGCTMGCITIDCALYPNCGNLAAWHYMGDQDA